MISDEAREIRNSILFALLWALILFAAWTWAAEVRADYILAFHGAGCSPCAAMEPVEQRIIREGYDLRPVMADERPELAQYYRITRVPCYVYVWETPRGCYDSGRRIVGVSTAAQLRRLATIPTATTAGAAVRSAVRGILGTPILLEW